MPVPGGTTKKLENADKNEELLDTVREQAKELDFLSQMVGFLMTDEQMYKIKERTEWSESKNKWTIPAPAIAVQLVASFLGRFSWFPMEKVVI